jgi:DNA-binding NarL/FixJ family response regulator
LIVDDHPGFRSLARRLLEAEGYVIVGEAEDGASAILAATALKPQLVLLDIQLPDHDGFNVTQKLLQHLPDAHIILTSSRDVSDYGRRLHTCGARGFISKSQLSGSALTAVLAAD